MEILSPASLRDQAERLRRRSRELRQLSARVLRRRDHAVHRLELRRELLRSEFEQLRAQRRHARAPGEDDGLDEWMRGEVLQMLAAGWTPRELADVGIGPELLRELRLDEHPVRCPPP